MKQSQLKSYIEEKTIPFGTNISNEVVDNFIKSDDSIKKSIISYIDSKFEIKKFTTRVSKDPLIQNVFRTKHKSGNNEAIGEGETLMAVLIKNAKKNDGDGDININGSIWECKKSETKYSSIRLGSLHFINTIDLFCLKHFLDTFLLNDGEVSIEAKRLFGNDVIDRWRDFKTSGMGINASMYARLKEFVYDFNIILKKKRNSNNKKFNIYCDYLRYNRFLTHGFDLFERDVVKGFADSYNLMLITKGIYMPFYSKDVIKHFRLTSISQCRPELKYFD